ncbi:MAG: PQQ-binding-like beta-propeller repeat protein [Thermoplasmata archaeon]
MMLLIVTAFTVALVSMSDESVNWVGGSDELDTSHTLDNDNIDSKSPSGIEDVRSSADSPWPMFRGDLRHTGRSPYDTSHVDGTEKWNFSADHDLLSSPVVGEDGTIYIGSWDYNLYAINPDGTEKWNFYTGDAVRPSAAIGNDGTIYMGSYSKKMYALNPDGTEKWNYSVNNSLNSSPAIGGDGTIYFGCNDDKLHAIYPNGTKKWSFKTGDIVASSPAIDDNGTIYVGSKDSNLYAINPNGTEKWKFSTGEYVYSSPAIGSDGTIYVGSYNNRLYAINPNGTQKWSFTTDATVRSSPAIGSGGTIYFGSRDNKLYAVRPNGSEKWSFQTDDQIESSPTIGSEGTIYFGSDDNNLYALNPDGTKKWTFSTDRSIVSSPVIGSDGTVYFGSKDNNLYAICGSPSVSIESPLEGDIISNTDILVEWSGSDDEVGIRSYEVQLDDGEWDDVGSNTNYSYNSSFDGKYTFKVKAIDNVDNMKIVTVNFTVDTTSPAVEITSPPDDAEMYNSSISVEWNGTDETTNIDHYEVKIDHGKWNDVGNSTDYTFENLTVDTHTIEVKATDEAGNNMTSSVHIKVTEKDDSGGDTPGFSFLIMLVSLFLVLIYQEKN